MKKTATVLFVILGLSIIAAMIGISTSANERANENLSFTVKTDRIVYDMTQQVITIPVKPNKSVNASDVHAVLTYGWDGNGSSEKVIGEVYLKDVQWTAGIEYTIMISAELSIDEIKSKDKVDLIVFYDGQMTITENLKPSSWTVVGPPSSTDSTSSESSTESTSSESSTENTSSESSTGSTSSESSTDSTQVVKAVQKVRAVKVAQKTRAAKAVQIAQVVKAVQKTRAVRAVRRVRVVKVAQEVRAAKAVRIAQAVKAAQEK